jgi:hypothetical protein
MLVCESMDGCLHFHLHDCKVIHPLLDHSIPSIEFSPTNSPEDEGKIFIHSNPLEQVHIVYTSVTKLSLAKRLVLLHLLGATDGNVVAICGHRNIIVYKIADQAMISCSEGMKDEDNAESCDPLPKPQLDGLDENARLTPLNNFFTLHNTCNNNTQQEVPSTLGVSISINRIGGRKQRGV